MLKNEVNEDGQIIDQIIKRIVIDFLDVIVVAHFKDEAFGISEVGKYLEERFKITLSSGTVYSAIYAMERNGLLEGYYLAFARMYKATPKGLHKVDLLTNSEKIGELMEKIIANSQVLCSLGGPSNFL
jgi:putative component of membrane protein insertase Oxa1/YidC/SpoIIIJ protein YidD